MSVEREYYFYTQEWINKCIIAIFKGAERKLQEMINEVINDNLVFYPTNEMAKQGFNFMGYNYTNIVILEYQGQKFPTLHSDLFEKGWGIEQFRHNMDNDKHKIRQWLSKVFYGNDMRTDHMLRVIPNLLIKELNKEFSIKLPLNNEEWDLKTVNEKECRKIMDIIERSLVMKFI